MRWSVRQQNTDTQHQMPININQWVKSLIWMNDRDPLRHMLGEGKIREIEDPNVEIDFTLTWKLSWPCFTSKSISTRWIAYSEEAKHHNQLIFPRLTTKYTRQGPSTQIQTRSIKATSIIFCFEGLIGFHFFVWTVQICKICSNRIFFSFFSFFLNSTNLKILECLGLLHIFQFTRTFFSFNNRSGAFSL